MKKNVIGTLGSVCLAVAAHAAVPEKIPAVVFEDVFDPGASHVQGACCSDDAVYLTQKTARLRGDRLRFFRVTTLTPPRRDNPSKKGIGASLSFFEYKDGSFIDITQ